MDSRLLYVPALALFIGCSSSRREGSPVFDYCEEMETTSKEIQALEKQNKELHKIALGEEREGRPSKGEREQIRRNEEKIEYLREYNLTNAENCGPPRMDQTAGAWAPRGN